MMSFAIAVVVSALAAHPCVAQSPTPTAPLPRQPAVPFAAAGAKPFQGILGGPPTQGQLAAKPDTRRVVCGLTVIQADSRVDARMVVRPKPGQTVAPKARIIEPKICQ